MVDGFCDRRRCEHCNCGRAQQYRRPSWSYSHQSSPLRSL